MIGTCRNEKVLERNGRRKIKANYYRHFSGGIEENYEEHWS
jgi:hypothetical protein